ncbi:MAG: hypothetical protein GX129_04640 [Clostridiales bacterium]|nr:hypothetical protein [Clostridiales bacterium]
MLQKIRNYFIKEHSKTISRSGKDKKVTLSSMAGRLLLIFFLAMLIFTFVSRAAASFTVAKVSVSSPKRDRLYYSISGIGEIIPINEERIRVEQGYRIENVYVSVGDKVSKDRALFSYDMKVLQDKYDILQNDIEKINILISIEKLRLEPTESKSSKPNLLSLKQAEENLEIAKTNLAEAEKEYERSISSSEDKENESWQEEYESRQKKYNTFLNSYESLVFQQEKQLKLSERSVQDAKDTLFKSNEKYSEINPLIDSYFEAVKSKEEVAVYRAGEAIFEAFYGGIDPYEKHRDAVFNIALVIQQEDYYLWYLWNQLLRYDEQLFIIENDLQNLENSMISNDNSGQTKEKLRQSYNEAWINLSNILKEYERQLELLEIGVDMGSSDLKGLRRDDKKLKEHLANYRSAIEEETDIEAPRANLYNYIMGDKAKTAKEEIDRATLALSRAEEDYEVLEKEFGMARNNLQLELTELEASILSMEGEIYDLSDTLDGKRQAVKSAKEAVRLAEQVVEMAKLQYEEASKPNNNQATTQITELNIQVHNIDLHKKEKELEEVGKLIDSSGEVLSPSEGIISQIGIEAGRSTTGEENIKIGTGIFVFKGAFIRDENINIELGGDVDISLAGKARAIESEIGKLSINTDGMTEFISSLPQGGDYYLGEKAEFKISMESEQFNQCIPIQALREDNYGYFVLVIGEQEDILGTQIIAERRRVELVAKGTSIVAVDGLLSNSQVITDSNKYINAGDRVRIE